MLYAYSNDGEVYDEKSLTNQKFHVNKERDIQKSTKKKVENGLSITQDIKNFNFVGFLINDQNEIFTVFPKKYKVLDLKKNSTELFRVISKHLQKRPELYIGNQYGENFETNYPFAAFFGVYEYFTKYGLYFEDRVKLNTESGKKVNWKETIRLSNKYLSDNRVSFFPLYYEKKTQHSVILTECMIFVINYTLDKFGDFIDLEKTGLPVVNLEYLLNNEIVIEDLNEIRQFAFKDHLIDLIDHLISFFENLHQGGNFYIKHYTFSTVWEDMVKEYLKNNYLKIENNKLILDKDSKKYLEFEKKSFHPNLANKDHFFAPDYYYVENGNQLIFDAKYYTELRGMDYKQIAYVMFLKEKRTSISGNPIYHSTFSALILPSEERVSKIHFKMAPLYSKNNADLIISEEYLNIREVMESYYTN